MIVSYKRWNIFAFHLRDFKAPLSSGPQLMNRYLIFQSKVPSLSATLHSIIERTLIKISSHFFANGKVY